jgi:hypothetical protein
MSALKFTNWKQVEDFLKTLNDDLFQIGLLFYDDVKQGEIDYETQGEELDDKIRKIVKAHKELREVVISKNKT